MIRQDESGGVESHPTWGGGIWLDCTYAVC